MKKILLLGAGTMGKVHAASYYQMSNAELVGVVDIQKEKADLLANEFGGKSYQSIEEAIETELNFDVIDISLPTFLHKDFVIKAANLNKDIICEKPLARNLDDAEEIITYCKDKNVKLFVGHVIRFFPEYKRAKRILTDGGIGKPTVARTSRGGVFPVGWEDWYANFEYSGGLVLDMIIHDFDFLQWCFGDVERVYAKGLLNSRPHIDYALVTLRFKSGVIAHMEGSWAHEGFRMAFELAGSEGIIDYDSSKVSPIVSVTRKKEAGAAGVAVPESPLDESPYYRELNHFITCLEENSQPSVTVEEAYQSMKIALAALDSIQTGKSITLT